MLLVVTSLKSMRSFFGNVSLLWAQRDFLGCDLTFAFMSFLVHVYKKLENLSLLYSNLKRYFDPMISKML